MSLDQLPSEIITKILSYLTEDEKGFIGLSSACKRFNLASHDLIHSDVWARDRPFSLELSRRDYTFDSREEMTTWFYDRIYRMLNAKYRNFSTLKLYFYMSIGEKTPYNGVRCGIIEAFRTSLRLSKDSVGLRIRALVGLELYHCNISVKWLNRIMIELVNLSYLTLDTVSFEESNTLFDPEDQHQRVASKYLKRLKIINSAEFTDNHFEYFLNNLPSSEFDISGSDVWWSYPQPADPIIGWQWTFTKVFLYLKKHHAVLKHFVASCTYMFLENLEEIIREEKLRHLEITVKFCPFLSLPEVNASSLNKLLTENPDRVTHCHI